MNSADLIESISEFKDVKNIDRPTIMKILEEVFKTMLKKKYGSEEHFDIIVNTDKGDLEIWRNRSIVEDGEVEDELEQISLSEAQLIDPDLEVGDDCYEEIKLESFGRRNILSALQTLKQKVNDLEKDEIFRKYKDRVGEIVTAELYQIWRKELLLLDDESNELILPKSELIKGDKVDNFKKGDTVRAVVKDVELKGSTPKIILSRTDPAFLAKLLELEVPEIFDGLISIRKIVREPGERAKVAVESYDDRIDPVGACVGMKGSRIHGIVRELRNENIDIINYTNNMSLLIQRALNPAKITSINIKEDIKRVAVYLKPDQVSLAIGKGGLNIKLASRLTGYEIDVFRDLDEEEDDVDLDEFADEIDAWVIDQLKGIGCDTAKSVLQLDRDDIVRRADLEEETVDEVLGILKAEFEQ